MAWKKSSPDDFFGCYWALHPTYLYVHFLPDTGIAWEYLRRNTEYQTDYDLFYKEYIAKQDVERKLCSISSLAQMGRRISLTRATARWEKLRDRASSIKNAIEQKWGLMEYQDYCLRGDEVNAFWSPQANKASVELKASTPTSRDRRKQYPIPYFRAHVKTLFKAGVAHVVTRKRGYPHYFFGERIPLSITRAEIRSNSQSKQAEAVRRRLIRYLGDDDDNEPADDPSGVIANRKRHVECLRVYDGIREGASRRQIAESILGEEAIEELWNDPDCRLKNWFKYRLKRATELIDGGYKDILSSADH
ncbi:DUF2285 domain-containing protein [Thalassospiraceae bacterium LMO-SO8]|nr:DUF2285 domain-containing protein [Alphaproteobacteria bacterium LMO-S08]WND75198.1 DUF2285 domain-containing protein [Thalassospiraceae bacterium LMO-SO8]